MRMELGAWVCYSRAANSDRAFLAWAKRPLWHSTLNCQPEASEAQWARECSAPRGPWTFFVARGKQMGVWEFRLFSLSLRWQNKIPAGWLAEAFMWGIFDGNPVAKALSGCQNARMPGGSLSCVRKTGDCITPFGLANQANDIRIANARDNNGVRIRPRRQVPQTLLFAAYFWERDNCISSTIAPIVRGQTVSILAQSSLEDNTPQTSVKNPSPSSVIYPSLFSPAMGERVEKRQRKMGGCGLQLVIPLVTILILAAQAQAVTSSPVLKDDTLGDAAPTAAHSAAKILEDVQTISAVQDWSLLCKELCG